jgi:hypothetical protein
VANQAGLSVEGTGIGLSLTTELVKIHGGSVTVESQIGVGSTFRVFIPLGRSHLPAKFIVEEGSTEWKHGLVAQYAEDMVKYIDFDFVIIAYSIALGGRDDGAVRTR